MTTVSTHGSTVEIDENSVTFRHPIKETVRDGDVVVVLLDVPVGTVDNRNVIGLSVDGDRLWEIEPISDDASADQAYVNLFRKGGDVWVSNPIGAECRLDLSDGSFAETRTKRW